MDRDFTCDNFNVVDVKGKNPVGDDGQYLASSDLLEGNNSNRDDPFKHVPLILHGMGMEKYLQIFQTEKVDLDSFLNLNDQDLRELGITDIKDREIIIENLKPHKSNTDEFKVSQNAFDDLKIAKNVHNQLVILQNYCAYAELQMKKHKLIDYQISSKEFASTYLKAFTESALTQANLMSERIFNKHSSDHLIGKALKVNKLTLPKYLEEKLVSKKKKKQKIVLKLAVILGFSSMIILIGKYLINNK